MHIETPLPTDHQLDQLAGPFAHWRQQRSHPSERIPHTLWEQAAALASVLPYRRVATHWRVSPSDLKKHMRAQQAPTPQAPTPALSCVEIPPPPAHLRTRPGTELELQRADGARLRLRSGESTLPLAALVRAFREGH